MRFVSVSTFWRVVLGAVIVWAGITAPAAAGTIMTIDTESFERSKPGGTATVYLDEQQMRIDSNEGGGDYTVIFRLLDERHVYWVVDHRTNTYVELNERDMDVIRSQTDLSRRQIEEQIAQLPPERRQALEPFYRKQLESLGRAEAPTTYRKVASGARVGDWECDHYEGYQGEHKQEEVWATSWDALGVRKQDLAAFGRLAAVLEGSGQKLPAFFHFGRDALAGERGLTGFPVMVVTYDGARPKEKSRLMEIRQEALRPQLFELPEGLTQRNIE